MRRIENPNRPSKEEIQFILEAMDAFEPSSGQGRDWEDTHWDPQAR